MEPRANETSTRQAMPMECQTQQWSPNTNAITYRLRGVYEGTTCEEPALAVTTRPTRGSAPTKNELDGQENYSSHNVERPQFQELEKVANAVRHAIRAVARDNENLDDHGGHNVLHDLEGSDMGHDLEFAWASLRRCVSLGWRKQVVTIYGRILAC